MKKKDKNLRPAAHRIMLGGKITEKDGSLAIALNSMPLYCHFLKTYCRVGDLISMELVNRRATRTANQNAFYAVYLDLIQLSTGSDPEDIRDYVREHILGKGIKTIYGREVHKARSSAKLNIDEFAEMMNQLQDLTEVPIPDPKPFNLPLTWDEYRHLKRIQTETYRGIKGKRLT